MICLTVEAAVSAAVLKYTDATRLPLTVWVFRYSESSKSAPGNLFACFADLQDNTKKNELAQKIRASSIES
jgi:hypothetical protein